MNKLGVAAFAAIMAVALAGPAHADGWSITSGGQHLMSDPQGYTIVDPQDRDKDVLAPIEMQMSDHGIVNLDGMEAGCVSPGSRNGAIILLPAGQCRWSGM